MLGILRSMSGIVDRAEEDGFVGLGTALSTASMRISPSTTYSICYSFPFRVGGQLCGLASSGRGQGCINCLCKSQRRVNNYKSMSVPFLIDMSEGACVEVRVEIAEAKLNLTFRYGFELLGSNEL